MAARLPDFSRRGSEQSPPMNATRSFAKFENPAQRSHLSVSDVRVRKYGHMSLEIDSPCQPLRSEQHLIFMPDISDKPQNSCSGRARVGVPVGYGAAEIVAALSHPQSAVYDARRASADQVSPFRPRRRPCSNFRKPLRLESWGYQRRNTRTALICRLPGVNYACAVTAIRNVQGERC